MRQFIPQPATDAPENDNWPMGPIEIAISNVKLLVESSAQAFDLSDLQQSSCLAS